MIIEEDLVTRLELNGPTMPLCMQWTNETTPWEDASKLISLHIVADNGKSPYYRLHNVITGKK